MTQTANRQTIALGEAGKTRRKKKILLSEHARKRILRYRLDGEEVMLAVRSPDEIVEGCGGRKVIHKFRGMHVLRVVC